jgi:hypothetical protein
MAAMTRRNTDEIVQKVIVQERDEPLYDDYPQINNT